MSKQKLIGALTIALVACFTFHGFAQVSLTPLEVRTANLMLDNCQRDTALLRQCKLDVVSLNRELSDAKGVIALANSDIAALERLDSSRVANLNVCHKTVKDLKKSCNDRFQLHVSASAGTQTDMNLSWRPVLGLGLLGVLKTGTGIGFEYSNMIGATSPHYIGVRASQRIRLRQP